MGKKVIPNKDKKVIPNKGKKRYSPTTVQGKV
jgi:hypothetical protein